MSALPDRPVTPQRDALVNSFVHSTPLNLGSASHSSFATQHTQETYEPFIEEDLRHRVKLSYTHFIENLFGPSRLTLLNNEDTHNISLKEDYTNLVNDFAAAITDETRRYLPFVNLVNYIFRLVDKLILGSHYLNRLHVLSCRNDPTTIRGSKASRIPDVVLARHSDVERTWDGHSRMEKEVREKHPFRWSDVISFFEHKHPTKTRLLLTTQESGHFVQPVSASAPVTPTEQRAAPESLAAGTDSLAPPLASSRSSRSSRSSNKRSAPSQEPSDSVTRPKRNRIAPEEYVDHRKAMRQTASYMVEMTSHGPIRSHSIVSLVIDGTIELIYCTHSTIVTCEPIHFLKEPEKFLQMMLGLASFRIDEWGIPAKILPADGPPPETTRSEPSGIVSNNQFEGSTLTLHTGDILGLGRTVYRQHGLIGRGTCVFEAFLSQEAEGTRVKWPEEVKARGKVVVKISWPAKTRTPEREFFDTVRRKVDGDIRHKWIWKHLPTQLHAEEDGIDDMQARFKLFIGEKFELREMRTSVQEVLIPIVALTAHEEVLTAWRGVFKCYKWLYEVAGIMHRDISINNFMFRRKDGKVIGVLIDLDLAVYLDAIGQSSAHRTGTKPFLAIDLLEQHGIQHIYRFDLESMFYVMVWHVFRHHEGREIRHPPYQKWAEAVGEDLVNAKRAFVTKALGQPTEKFIPLRSRLENIRLAFATAILRRPDKDDANMPGYDDATLGGYISFETFGGMLGSLDEEE